MINSIILWNITNVIMWFILFKYRAIMIKGAEGTNGLWELNEQVSFVFLWLISPILTYSAFFGADLPVWCWYLLVFGVAYTLGGRWILEWILAFKSGSAKVKSSKDENTKTE